MKVGAVSYLNSKPLIHGLKELLPPQDFVLDLPSRLADRLERGELDVALIPVVEAVSHPEYTVVSDACIACQGPVWSVKLISRVPFAQIRSLALDEGSRTSAALVKVLLMERFGVRPTHHSFPIHTAAEALDCDAALIIGDRAMRAPSAEYKYVWDLGQEWIEETQLPFVFAVWTARSSLALQEMEQLLTTARDSGIRAINAIAEAEAPRYNLSIEQCRRYLEEHLHFFLGAREREGLGHFLRRASHFELVKNSCELTYYDCQTT